VYFVERVRMFALQIDEEKKTKKNAKRVFTFVSLLHQPFILFSKNGTIAMAYKKKQNERKRHQSVKKIFVVIVLMTSREKKRTGILFRHFYFRLSNVLAKNESYCSFIHFENVLVSHRFFVRSRRRIFFIQ
jgi:hypothetical protein